jgi:DNA repair exonuclease SbcCD ATPase subunit
MMKNVVVIVLALVALGTIAPTARADQYDDLAVKVAQLQKALHELESLVKSLTYDVQESKGFGQILRQLAYEMKRTEAAVSDLQVFAKRVTLEVYPKLSHLESSVAGLITSTKEKLDGLAGRIFTVEANLDQFGVRVSTLEERTRHLLELQDRVARIEEMLAKMQEMPGVPSQDLHKINERLAAVQKSLQGLDGQVTRLANRLDNEAAQLKEQIRQLEKRVAGAEGSAGLSFWMTLLAMAAAAVAFLFAVDP